MSSQLPELIILSNADIKNVDSHVKDLLFGYIRNAEALLNTVIPEGISIICLSFYYLVEYFAIADPKSYYIVHCDNCTTVEKLNRDYDKSVYGNVLISSSRGGIYEWTFKILHGSSSMYIGISTEHGEHNKFIDFYDNENGHNYSLSSAGYFKKNGKEVHSIRDGYNSDDVFKMTLDLNARTLTYTLKTKDEDRYNGFDDIPCGMNIHYKMALRFLNKRNKVALLDFRTE